MAKSSKVKKEEPTASLAEIMAAQRQSIGHLEKSMDNVLNDLGIITATDGQLAERLSNIKEVVFATAETAAGLRENHNQIKTGLETIDVTLKHILQQLSKPSPFWQFMSTMATKYWELAFLNVGTQVIAITLNTLIVGGLLIGFLGLFGVDYDKGVESIQKTTEAAEKVINLKDKLKEPESEKP